jgi:hypothetical protein
MIMGSDSQSIWNVPAPATKSWRASATRRSGLGDGTLGLDAALRAGIAGSVDHTGDFHRCDRRRAAMSAIVGGFVVDQANFFSEIPADLVVSFAKPEHTGSTLCHQFVILLSHLFWGNINSSGVLCRWLAFGCGRPPDKRSVDILPADGLLIKTIPGCHVKVRQ